MTGDDRCWRVGELASATGLTIKALHHYDGLGLLVPSQRTSAGHRLYGDARRAAAVSDARASGASQRAISATVRLHAGSATSPRKTSTRAAAPPSAAPGASSSCVLADSASPTIACSAINANRRRAADAV